MHPVSESSVSKAPTTRNNLVMSALLLPKRIITQAIAVPHKDLKAVGTKKESYHIQDSLPVSYPFTNYNTRIAPEKDHLSSEL